MSAKEKKKGGRAQRKEKKRKTIDNRMRHPMGIRAPPPEMERRREGERENQGMTKSPQPGREGKNNKMKRQRKKEGGSIRLRKLSTLQPSCGNQQKTHYKTKSVGDTHSPQGSHQMSWRPKENFFKEREKVEKGKKGN